MFTEMRCAFAAERWKINDSVWESEDPVPGNIPTARDMLTAATLDGAHVAGLEGRTGSLTPGKQADVVVIDGKGPAMAPVIDPVAAVVLFADTSNVKTVIIDGKLQKRDGRLLADWDAARERLQRSCDHLLETRAERQEGQEQEVG
jgi:cytosine/adenosine deaminase-related metal-dependent hydrolase